MPMRLIQLRFGVARVLTFANTASEINEEPGLDITVWARRGSVQDMVHEHNEKAAGQRADVPDAIVPVSLKVHISFMRPLCTTRVFRNALGEQKLTNHHYLESSHRSEESESRGEVERDAAIASRNRGGASP